ncbi:MAG TPA: hypothetical protein VFX19_13890 [Dehalococcoidia bacterium]|jgi:hypothetical protein|nr:hypothetical protein [Dehalococcoidia bacterium]
MLLSDMKGFTFKFPDLAALKRLLPRKPDGETDDDDLFTEADEDVLPQRPNLIQRREEPAPSPSPAVKVVRLSADNDEELPSPMAYDSHQPNLNRTDLEEPDPEIDAVVASLAEDDADEVEDEETVEEAAEEPAAEDPDDIMSFFGATEEHSKVPSALTDDLQPVAVEDLLSQAREIRALLGRRRDAA